MGSASSDVWEEKMIDCTKIKQNKHYEIGDLIVSLGCFQRLSDFLYDNLDSVILVFIVWISFLFVSKCSNLDLFTQFKTGHRNKN